MKDEKNQSCPQERLVLTVAALSLHIKQRRHRPSLQESKIHVFIVITARVVNYQHRDVEKCHYQKKDCDILFILEVEQYFLSAIFEDMAVADVQQVLEPAKAIAVVGVLNRLLTIFLHWLLVDWVLVF